MVNTLHIMGISNNIDTFHNKKKVNICRLIELETLRKCWHPYSQATDSQHGGSVAEWSKIQSRDKEIKLMYH